MRPVRAYSTGAGVGRGCGCASGDLVVAMMDELGMAHAAAMHADPDRDWTARDWRDHVAEEHDVLFPALRSVGVDEATLARLETDHAVYLERLSEGLDLPRGSEPYSVDVHGGVEDELVRQYAADLRSRTRVVVGGPIYGAVMDAGAAAKSTQPHTSSSWWPWVVGSALGAGAWAVGFGPLGIALTAASGAGGTYVAQRVVEPKSKPPQILMVTPPIMLSDPESYFQKVAEQGAEVHAIAATRQDESDERVREWKNAAKKIPYVGDYAGYLIDFGAWLGKVLGSNYAEENSPEDVQHAADGIAAWLRFGLVPPLPQFTAKNGANSYGLEMDRGIEALRVGPDKSEADNLTAKALTSMATLTMLHAGCPAMMQAIVDAGNGNGSLRGVGWYPIACVPGALGCSTDGKRKLVGFERIVAAIAHCAYGVPLEASFAYARRVTDHSRDYPIRAGLTVGGYLQGAANAFTEVMRAASHGEIK